jgi:small subunit ribosomal protein S16
VVVADGRSPIKGRFIETVGWYDPRKRGRNFSLQMERIEYWSGQGAQMSDTVSSLVKQHRLAPPKAEAAAEAAPAPAAEETPTADLAPEDLEKAAAAETVADAVGAEEPASEEPAAEEEAETPKA